MNISNTEIIHTTTAKIQYITKITHKPAFLVLNKIRTIKL